MNSIAQPIQFSTSCAHAFIYSEVITDNILDIHQRLDHRSDCYSICTRTYGNGTLSLVALLILTLAIIHKIQQVTFVLLKLIL